MEQLKNIKEVLILTVITVVLTVILTMIIRSFIPKKKPDVIVVDPDKETAVIGKRKVNMRNFIRDSKALNINTYGNQKSPKYIVKTKDIGSLTDDINTVKKEINATINANENKVLFVLRKYTKGRYTLPYFSAVFYRSTGQDLATGLLRIFDTNNEVEQLYSIINNVEKNL